MPVRDRHALVVRPATEDDIAAIHAVRVATWRDTYAGIVPSDVLEQLREDDAEAIAAQRERFRQPHARTHLLVAQSGGHVVGFAAIGPERQSAQPGAAVRTDAEDGEIYALYVLPAQQGRGIGRKLLDAALRLLRSDGFPRVTLWVLDFAMAAETDTRFVMVRQCRDRHDRDRR